jgi:hypothetical protein
MRSHEYHLSGRQAVVVILRPLLGLALAAGCLHLAHWVNALPRERARTDPERTVLAFKREAASAPRSARILLIGDSSCMMGVDAPLLSRSLPGRPAVLNLSLIYGLSLRTGADLAAEFARRHEGQVEWVVLLVTPPKLAEPESDRAFATLWQSLDPSRRMAEPEAQVRWEHWIGVDLFRDRALPSLLAVPLRGRGAAFYGFTSGVWTYLDTHDGSMVDLGTFHRPAVKSEMAWEPGAALEWESRAVRVALPAGVRLAAGLTPLPESLGRGDWLEQRTKRLREWGAWLAADLLLTDLPACLPDGMFATGAHLDARGQERFTLLLASEMARELRVSPETKDHPHQSPSPP